MMHYSLVQIPNLVKWFDNQPGGTQNAPPENPKVNRPIGDKPGSAPSDTQWTNGTGQNQGNQKQSPSGVGNPVAIERRGSTGRTIPNNLNEQMAMNQVKSEPLRGATHLRNVGMNDPRWPASEGWQKWAINVDGVEIHFNFNPLQGLFDDFKFKN